MAIEHLTEESFDLVTGQGKSLVDFWASWCGPCRMQSPILEQLDEAQEGSVKICKVDIDEQPELASRFGIMSIPTLLVMEDGEVLDMRVGVQSLDELKRMIN